MIYYQSNFQGKTAKRNEGNKNKIKSGALYVNKLEVDFKVPSKYYYDSNYGSYFNYTY